MERRSKAAGERGWKNGQSAVRFRDGADGRLEISGEADRRRMRRRSRRAPPPRRPDVTDFDLVPSFCC